MGYREWNIRTYYNLIYIHIYIIYIYTRTYIEMKVISRTYFIYIYTYLHMLLCPVFPPPFPNGFVPHLPTWVCTLFCSIWKPWPTMCMPPLAPFGPTIPQWDLSQLCTLDISRLWTNLPLYYLPNLPNYVSLVQALFQASFWFGTDHEWSQFLRWLAKLGNMTGQG